MNNTIKVIRPCEVELEQCQTCFEYKETIAQLYDYRTCFDCWSVIILNHLLEELNLNKLHNWEVN